MMWEYIRPDELYHNQYQKGLHWKWKKKKKAIKEFINPSPKVTFEEAKIYKPGSYEDRNAKFHALQQQKKYEYNERKKQKNPLRRMFSEKTFTTHKAILNRESVRSKTKRTISNNINRKVNNAMARSAGKELVRQLSRRVPGKPLKSKEYYRELNYNSKKNKW